MAMVDSSPRVRVDSDLTRVGEEHVSLAAVTRVTVAEDGSRVREITSGGVLHVA